MIKFAAKCAMVLAAGMFLFATVAFAQSTTIRAKALQRLVDTSDKLATTKKALLSSGMKNFLRAARRELNSPPPTTNALTASTNSV